MPAIVNVSMVGRMYFRYSGTIERVITRFLLSWDPEPVNRERAGVPGDKHCRANPPRTKGMTRTADLRRYRK